MSGVSVTFSLKDLKRLRQPGELQPGVQITKAGGFLRGRYVGKRNSVFGVDVWQVMQRLSSLESARSVVVPKSCDVALDRAERRGNSL